MRTFKDYFLCEVKDSKRNVEDLMRAYNLADEKDAKDLIKSWNIIEPYIDPNEDYGFPRNQNINPKDIFAWSRVTKSEQMPYTSPDLQSGYSQLKGMINWVEQVKQKKEKRKDEEGNYDVVYENEFAVVYVPHTEGASCKLGRGTKWCTAAKYSTNHFDDYTINKNVTLFYIHTKKALTKPMSFVNGPHIGDTPKWAIALYPDGRTMEVFDEEDYALPPAATTEVLETLQIPEETFMKYLPDAMSILLKQIEQAVSIISGQSRSEEADDYSIIEQLYDTVYKRFQGGEEFEALQRHRAKTKEPDRTFALIPWHPSSIMWATNPQFNNPEDGGNEIWEEQFVRELKRYLFLDKQANDDAEEGLDVHQGDQNEMKVFVWYANKTKGSIFIVSQLIDYMNAHKQGHWPELEKELLELTDRTEVRQGPFTYDSSILQAVIRGKAKARVRWTEYEDLIIDRMKEFQSEPTWEYQGEVPSFPGSDDLEHRPTFWDRWIRKANFYNVNWSLARGLEPGEVHVYIPDNKHDIDNLDDWPRKDTPNSAEMGF